MLCFLQGRIVVKKLPIQKVGQTTCCLSTAMSRAVAKTKTKDYIYIFEFKYDKTPDEALRQIDEKGYFKPYASDPRRLIKIGVNFSKEKRCVDGWKVVRSK